MDFHQLAVTQHLRNFLGFFLRLQCGCFAFLLIFADSRHAVGNHDGNQNADRLIPVRLAHEAQHHLDDQRHEQNHNHRVFEALKDFLPQRFRGNLRESIRAVLLAAFLHLLFVQPLKIHCSSSTSLVSAPDCAFCQPYICYFTSYFLVLQVSSGVKKHQIHPTVVLSVAKPQATASIIHFSRPKARGGCGHGREIPCVRERAAMVASPASWSRPSGATQHRWWIEQLGGVPAGARSYWQGRFAACALLTSPFE